MSEGYLNSREKFSTEVDFFKEAKFWCFFSIMKVVTRGGEKRH